MTLRMADLTPENLSRTLADAASGPAGGQRDLIAIGASAGGVEALSQVAAGLPRELPAAVLVVLHVLPTGTSVLPQILERAGALPASSAENGEPLERGHIYVAPPDHHLLVWDGRIQLSRGPRENGHRPGVDPTFRSAARNYGDRVIGVVLSGTLDDGTAGMRVVKSRGGVTVAQDPDDCSYPGMPQSAIDHGVADHVLPVGGIPDCICSLLDKPVEASPPAPETAPRTNWAPTEVTLDLADNRRARDGQATGLTCPECGGTLWAHEEGDLLRFRCHVGHAYSTQSMQIEQSRALETALWSALRSLEEQADLYKRIARRSSASSTSRRFEKRAAEASHHADTIRNTILDLGRSGPEDLAS
jgi:two-component system, chemotaxis family, protein-glutamate methylesterase/glutaminase